MLRWFSPSVPSAFPSPRGSRNRLPWGVASVWERNGGEGSLALWRCFSKPGSGCFSSGSGPSTRIVRGHLLSRPLLGTRGHLHPSVRPPARPPGCPGCLSPHTSPQALSRPSSLAQAENEAWAHAHQPPLGKLRATGRRARGSSGELARELSRSEAARQLVTSRGLDPAPLAASRARWLEEAAQRGQAPGGAQLRSSQTPPTLQRLVSSWQRYPI